jgi:light-regulated signal transduction histidine kinase (bacteriophytochrome)
MSPLRTDSSPNAVTSGGLAKVLVVEDDAITALGLSEALEETGYLILGPASSGEEAIDLAERYRPDLVLMDVSLGGELSGTEAAQIIYDRFDTPVIYVTGYSNPATIEEIGEAGEDGFLRKPVLIEDLQTAIQLALGRRRRQQRQLAGQLQEFTYSAGHDLQEPLRNACNLLEVVESRLASHFSDEDRRLMIQARGSLEGMKFLLQDLLEYAEAGHAMPEMRGLISAEAALKWAEDNLGSAIRESGAQIVRDALPCVNADPTQLTRVFQNLLSNAIKYCRTGEAPRIKIDASDSGTAWIFRVSDQGIGFDPEYAETIFRPFRRLHSASAYPGSGLGLTICAKIVEAHGGEMWAVSGQGEGAAFYFSLPQSNL